VPVVSAQHKVHVEGGWGHSGPARVFTVRVTDASNHANLMEFTIPEATFVDMLASTHPGYDQEPTDMTYYGLEHVGKRSDGGHVLVVAESWENACDLLQPYLSTLRFRGDYRHNTHRRTRLLDGRWVFDVWVHRYADPETDVLADAALIAGQPHVRRVVLGGQEFVGAAADEKPQRAPARRTS
jgi:hypothetical protein